MNNKGMTLIELVIVITIIGILAGALAFSFQSWMSGYNTESQIKQLHGDLMDARTRTKNRNRMHFVDLTAAQYTVYEDTDPAPDGDGTPNPANDTLVFQKSLNASYPITWSDPSDTRIEFDTKGLSNDDKTICNNTAFDAEADYDCIVITATRIKMGRLTTPISSGGACDAANCVEK
ncbi:MAG: type II secretion system protein [Nitrospirae bacterium]|nr:type II secretion system protein [Nitrospirota bacterium]